MVEIVKYVVTGFITTIINFSIDMGLRTLGVNYGISIGLAWVVSILFAYFANKKFVFKNESTKISMFITFVLSRISTLIIEYILSFVMISVFDMNQLFVKISVQIIIMVTNYILGMKIFSKNKSGGSK